MINKIIYIGSTLFAVSLWIFAFYLFTQIGTNS